MKRLFVVLLVLSAVMSLSAKADLVMQIDRVFMNKPGDYSIAYTQPNKAVGVEKLNEYYKLDSPTLFWDWANKNYLSDWNPTEVHETIIADVPQDKPMYLLATGQRSKIKVEIHVHSSKDINGGEWSTGEKNPKHGQTQTIE